MSSEKLKVLVVEDSRVSREMLVRLLESDPGIRVVHAVGDGASALAAVQECRPDVVTMDPHLPEMDGFETTRRIMESHPVPIVIVSAHSDADEVAKSFRAMEAGAVAAVERPTQVNGHLDARATHLIATVKAMAGVKVVRRWPRARAGVRLSASLRAKLLAPTPVGEIQLVAIGASTGGPPVLRTILAGLGAAFPVPVLVVQHISSGFVQGLAEWLDNCSELDVRLARHGEYGKAGHVYLAPDGCHMTVNRFGQIVCLPGQPENGLQPAVSCLFRSVAEHFGPRAAGVLLTGMGRDGAEELKLMRDAGGVTIAQDKDSSVVHGMPGEAIAIGAAAHVLPPDRIVAHLQRLVEKPCLPALQH
jgi:two-component system chemotaxis response regulator CheB